MLSRFALFLLIAGAACAASPAPEERPVIEVAFCIDTTGSMQSYIDATKKKVWDIANGLLKGTPRPIVRLAVVAFRDRNEAYVTQHLDLTDDIDKVHSYLMGLTADGGGDHPEHVTAGLRDCVEKLTWSKGKRVLKAVYLIGDAPAHTDYDDGDYKPVAKAAIARGINIHTLSCTGQAEVAQWQEIAKLTDGQFIQLPPASMMSAARAPGRLTERGRSRPVADSAADMAGGAPMAPGAALAAPADAKAEKEALAAEAEVGDKILNSLKSEAKKKGVADY